MSELIRHIHISSVIHLFCKYTRK